MNNDWFFRDRAYHRRLLFEARTVTNRDYKFCLKISLFYCIHEDLNDFQMIDSLDFSNDCQKPMITSKYLQLFSIFVVNV